MPTEDPPLIPLKKGEAQYQQGLSLPFQGGGDSGGSSICSAVVQN